MSDTTAGAKSKSQMRAERRAVQEAQRATKATGKPSAGQQQQQQQKPRLLSESGSTQQQPQLQPSNTPQSKTSNRKKTPSITEGGNNRSRSRDKSNQQQQQNTENLSSITGGGVDGGISIGQTTATVRRGSRDETSGKILFDVHPAFAQLACRLNANGSISGSDAQCLAMIDAFKQLALDFQPQGDKAYSREFENAIKPCISRISGNRSLPPATASLVKQLKLHLSNIPNETVEKEARELVIEWLDDFADRQIVLSTRAIAEAVTCKLKTMTRGGSQPMVVMIYTFSATVEKTLMEAHRQGVPFEVIIVDSMPKKEGYISVRRLSAIGIKCQYVLLTGISAVLSRVNVVLLGAEGLLANGNVVAPLGSTQVAMTANARNNVPVLVLCHTYKFCEKVFTVTLETDWPDTEVMPADFVTGVVTELRTLPCSAVPAVLRVKQLGGGIS